MRIKCWLFGCLFGDHETCCCERCGADVCDDTLPLFVGVLTRFRWWLTDARNWLTPLLCKHCCRRLPWWHPTYNRDFCNVDCFQRHLPF